MRSLVFAALFMALLFGLTQVWLSPPLKAPPRPDESVIDHLSLSEPAFAGASAFASQCSECHGLLGQGGVAPNLLYRDYALDFRNAPAFHEDAQSDIKAHKRFLRRVARNDTTTFNELEMMAKFLRELRLKGDLPEVD